MRNKWEIRQVEGQCGQKNGRRLGKSKAMRGKLIITEGLREERKQENKCVIEEEKEEEHEMREI